jgi:hypothetical protein
MAARVSAPNSRARGGGQRPSSRAMPGTARPRDCRLRFHVPRSRRRRADASCAFSNRPRMRKRCLIGAGCRSPLSRRPLAAAVGRVRRRSISERPSLGTSSGVHVPSCRTSWRIPMPIWQSDIVMRKFEVSLSTCVTRHVSVGGAHTKGTDVTSYSIPLAIRNAARFSVQMFNE